MPGILPKCPDCVLSIHTANPKGFKVEIAFASRDLREICENDTTAREKLGQQVTRKLITRLAELDAASSVLELPHGCPYSFKEKKAIFDLLDGYKLVISPNHPDNPVTDSDGIDWSRVYRIKVTDITDSHD